jgi:hypothetical protein
VLAHSRPLGTVNSFVHVCPPSLLNRQQRFLSLTDRNQPVNWRAAVNQRIREDLAQKPVSGIGRAGAALSPTHVRAARRAP